MNARSPTALVLLLLLAAGCSDEANDGTSTRVGDPAKLIRETAAAQCRKILECCSSEELEQVFAGSEVSDQAGCEAAVVGQADAFFKPALQHALDRGTAALDDSAITTCVVGLDGRSCGTFEPRASADVLTESGCEGVVVPQLTLSGFCSEDFECDTGFCSHPPSDTDGACKMPPQLDEPCLHDRCGGQLACGPDAVCVEKLGVGELCARNADCETDLCAPGRTGELVCEDVARSCAGS